MNKKSFTIFWLLTSILALAFSVVPARATSKLLAMPSKTPTRTPTPASEMLFDPAVADKFSPSDVDALLDEIAFMGMGGGEGDSDPCKGIKKPTIISAWEDVEQMQTAWVLSCGWNKRKDVTVTMRKSNGKIETFTLDTAFQPAYWSYRPTITDPLGNYTLTLVSGSQSVQTSFQVSPPSEAGALMFYKEKTIQVYKFQPNERIRLFRYILNTKNLNAKLDSWKEFTTDGRGNLKIRLTITDGLYVVVGRVSGEFQVTGSMGQSVLKANGSKASNKSLCNGAPASRVTLGNVARVTFTDGTPNRLRSQASTSAKILGRLAEGSQFTIVKGPTCKDGYTWWQVGLENGARGWVAEGSKAKYFIEPVSAAQLSCKKMRARLEIGDQARVAETDGTNMRIREAPGFSRSILARVPEGTVVKILDGPRCVDGNNWWKIRSGSQEGWMTESQNGTYLLEPKR